MTYSDAYVDALQAGPFPGRIDPWAENDRYFRPIHSNMMNYIVEHLHDAVRRCDLLLATHTSMQEDDVWHFRLRWQKSPNWRYEDAATQISADVGILAYPDKHERRAIHIWDTKNQKLITVVEIIVPTTKADNQSIEQYRRRRELLLWHGVNVVEIDATRSPYRVFDHELTTESPYHIAIFMPDAYPRVLPSAFHEPLKRFALPLHDRVVAVDAQLVYEKSYALNTTGQFIVIEKKYTDADLPFPELISADQRAALLDAVAAWRTKLESLRAESQ